jgi:hypothetical protein
MCVCVPLTRCRTVVEPVSPTVGMITRTSLKCERAALLARLRISVDWRRGYAPNLFRCSKLPTSLFGGNNQLFTPIAENSARRRTIDSRGSPRCLRLSSPGHQGAIFCKAK